MPPRVKFSFIALIETTYIRSYVKSWAARDRIKAALSGFVSCCTETALPLGPIRLLLVLFEIDIRGTGNRCDAKLCILTVPRSAGALKAVARLLEGALDNKDKLLFVVKLRS